MTFAVALASSYLLFFFVSESGHPFKTPDGSVKRKRWRFARLAASIHLVAAVAGIAFAQFWSMGLVWGLIVFLAITFVAHSVVFCAKQLGQLKTTSSSKKTIEQRGPSDNLAISEPLAQSNSDPSRAKQHTTNKNTGTKRVQPMINPALATLANEHSVNRDKKVDGLLVEKSEHIML